VEVKMFRKIVSIILVCALFNILFFSCRKQVDIPADYIGPEDKEKIVEVILPDGHVIPFKKNGAVYKILPETVRGKSTLGEQEIIDLRIIQEIRLTTPEVFSNDKIDPQKITEIITMQNTYVKIGAEGCRLMDDQKTYQCKTINGADFQFQSDMVKEIRTGEATTISKDQLKEDKNIKIKEIIYKKVDSEKLIAFDKDGGRYFAQRHGISGIVDGGKQMYIDLNEVLYVRVERENTGATCLAAVGVLALVVGAIFLIALATKESCPFVYSYNGEQYVFDAEPLGGAISEGLKKADYSELEHIQPVNGTYRLLFRNEVEEIQYLDEVKLLIMDYDPDYTLTPDMFGNFYSQRDPIVSLSAYDKKDLDLRPFVNKNDNIVWQTHLPVDSSYKAYPLRHQLTFEFPKPSDAKYAKLIVNAGTALWGSNMIREMIQLRGNNLDQWYKGINNHAKDFNELYNFIDREELYLLHLYIDNNGKWEKSEHFISGGGPLITEERIIPLDVANIAGNSLRIRLNPPIGFWTIDYMAVEYDFFKSPVITEIAPRSAINQNEKQLVGSLLAIDDNYGQMLELGDWFTVEFDAPTLKEGLKRNIFLKTFGYYEIQVDKKQPEKTELIQYLLKTPGTIVEYSMDEYLKWRQNLLTSY